MIVEEAAPLYRTQGDSEEEEESDEKNLEISLRMEANMLEDRAKRDLLHTWREAKEYKEEAEKEAARYRDSTDRQFRKAGARCNTLQNASYTIQEAAARRTDKMKDRARLRYVEEMEKLKQLRKRVREVRWKRLEAEKER